MVSAHSSRSARTLVVLGALLVCVAAVTTSTAKDQKLKWTRSWKSAEKAAAVEKRNDGKDVLVVITAKGTSDPLVRALKKERRLQKGWRLVGLALKHDPSKPQKFEVTETPTVLLVSGRGRVRQRWVGAAECDVDEIARIVDQSWGRGRKTPDEVERSRLGQERRNKRLAQAKIDEKKAEQERRAARIAEAEAKEKRINKARLAPAPAVRDPAKVKAAAEKERARPWHTERSRRVLALDKDDKLVDALIEPALQWLAKHQTADGRWEVSSWTRNCQRKASCPSNAPGDPMHEPGLSGLVVLAFLGQGHTPNQGPHMRVLTRALDYLKRQQAADGSLGFKGWFVQSAYDHAIATQALCEAYAATGDGSLAGPAQKALDFAVKAQNPGLGWKYGVKSGRNDTSVTVWMLQALAAGKAAGLKVGEEALGGGRRWLQRAASSRGEIGYESPGGGSARYRLLGDRPLLPTTTAAGLVGRFLAGGKRDRKEEKLGLKLVEAMPPSLGSRGTSANHYYWFYGAHALALAGDNAARRKWRAALRTILKSGQVKDGCARGSWKPQGPWAEIGGRPYATAMNVLALQAPIRIARSD